MAADLPGKPPDAGPDAAPFVAPRVSVIVCAYRSGERILPTLQAILAQSFGDFELLLIDDCSGDDTPDILARVGDPRIRRFTNEQNLGVAGSRNEGLARARGEYVAHCDHDDIWVADKLAKQVEYLDAHPAAGLVGTDFAVLEDEVFALVESEVLNTSNYLKWRLLQSSCFLHSSVMFRRSTIVEHQIRYDARLEFADDWSVYHKVAKVAELGRIGEMLAEYHLHGQNWSTLALEEMSSRGAQFLGAEIAVCAGYPVSRELARSYFNAVVLRAPCSGREELLAVGRLIADLYESFNTRHDLAAEERAEIRRNAGNLWWDVVRHTASVSGVRLLRQRRFAEMPDWPHVHPASYLRAVFISGAKRLRRRLGV